MIASAVAAFWFYFFTDFADETKIVYVTIISIVVWIIVTILTKPTEDNKLVEFYKKVRPGGIGWRRIGKLAPEVVPDSTLHLDFLNWVLGVTVVFTFLFGLGRVLLGQVISGIGLLVLSVVIGAIISRNLKTHGWTKSGE
jgi:hypothetical protein